MIYDKITLDAKSVRTVDRNGYMHVAISPLTKEQVAPYHGFEIPNYDRLGFSADGTYYGYRSALELSKPETIESMNGIPIQYRHHIDSAENPAKNTRVGSTGTDGAFRHPYVTNSLHIQDEQAIKSINDGSLRELSLAYWYDPVKESGNFNGQPFDFLMTNIRANHVALVDEGRAGSDVLVYDSKFVSTEGNRMEKKDFDPKKFADLLAPAIAEAVKKALAEGPAEDEDEDAEKTDPNLSEKDTPKDEPKAEEVAEGEAETPAEADEPEAAPEDEPEDESDQAKSEDDLGVDADVLKACGMDGEPPEIQRAFAAGVRYGERMEKREPEKLDREHEAEGEDCKVAQDAAFDALNRKFADKFDALENCRATLGACKFAAFDSAEDVYAAAFKKETGKTIDPKFARVAYESYLSGKAQAKTIPAQDFKSVDAEMESKVMAKFLD